MEIKDKKPDLDQLRGQVVYLDKNFHGKSHDRTILYRVHDVYVQDGVEMAILRDIEQPNQPLHVPLNRVVYTTVDKEETIEVIPATFSKPEGTERFESVAQRMPDTGEVVENLTEEIERRAGLNIKAEKLN